MTTTATTSPSAFQKSSTGGKAAANDDDRDDDNDDAVELLRILREMIANRQKFPELRKTCVQFFERKMVEDGGDEEERKYSIPPRICLDCVEILEDERRVREEENSDNTKEYEGEEDEFYDRNWGQEESFRDDDEEEAAPKASMKEIESERILLQFVIIESCTRATNVREAYTRNWFELKNITRSRVRCEKSRRRAANLVYFAAKERGGGAQQARVFARRGVVRGWQRGFLLGGETNDIVTNRVIEEYVEFLLEEAPGERVRDDHAFRVGKVYKLGNV